MGIIRLLRVRDKQRWSLIQGWVTERELEIEELTFYPSRVPGRLSGALHSQQYDSDPHGKMHSLSVISTICLLH